MIAIQIEPSVGRCESCRKFRNNMEWKVDEKVVCMDCFVTYRNQKLIDEIIKPVKEEKKRSRTIQRTRVYKEKEERIKSSGYVKKGYPKTRPTNVKNIILNHIKQSEKPLSVKEMFADRVSSKVTLYKYMRILLETNEIVVMRSTAKLYYIDTERKSLLEEFVKPTKKAPPTSREELVLEIIKSSSQPITPQQINEGQSWHYLSIYPVLNKLVEKGLIICSPVSDINKLYVDIDRADMLKEDIKFFERTVLLGRTRKKILEFIDSRNELTYTKDIVNHTGLNRTSIFKIIKDLKEKELIYVSYCGGKSKRGTVIAPINNKELKKQVDEIEYNSTENQVRRIMEKQDRGITINAILLLIGCEKSIGSRRYVKKLLESWGCKEVEINSGRGYHTGYYLEKKDKLNPL